MVSDSSFHGASGIIMLNPESNKSGQRAIVFRDGTLNLHHFHSTRFRTLVVDLCHAYLAKTQSAQHTSHQGKGGDFRTKEFSQRMNL